MNRTFVIRSGEIASRAASVVAGLPCDPLLEVVIRPHKSKRSLQQNALLHAWLREISQQHAESHGTFYKPELWKEYFRELFLGQKVLEVCGKVFERKVSTTELTVEEMTRFMEQIDHYCGSELHIFLPRPGEEAA